VIDTHNLWLFILASFIIGSLLIYSLRFRDSETGRAFILLMAAAFIWVFFYTFEIISTTVETKLLFSNIEFIGITLLPVSWIFLVLAFTGQKSSGIQKIALLIIPITTDIVVWTNPFHHWFEGNPTLIVLDNYFPAINMDYQFWFRYIHAPAGYLYLLIAVILLIRSIQTMGKTYQIQGNLLLLAILLPSVTDFLYVLGISPIAKTNYTTAVFSISGMILFLTLFQFRFLDLVPLARDTIIDNLNEGIVVLDHEHRVTYINPSAKITFGIHLDIIGKAVTSINSEFFEKVALLLKNSQTNMDIQIGDSPTRYYDLQISPIYSHPGKQIGLVITTRDITDRVQLFNQVQLLSTQDSLTGICNTRQFIEFSRRELIRIQRYPDAQVVVAMVDMDNFKNINDTFGHACGNLALMAFTHTIQEILRRYDIFGRVGGDEFAILLRDVTMEDAMMIVERLRVSIENLRIPFEGAVVSITTSFGIVSSQQLDKSNLEIDTMLHLADKALYIAKRAGRNRVVVYSDADNQTDSPIPPNSPDWPTSPVA
jgi:diguanylate cyclase (GGDEF)-like protein/PAS domain S-box-containing protein